MVRLFPCDSAPIVALATPPGVSGVAVLRLSGGVGLLERVLPLLRLANGVSPGVGYFLPRTLRLVEFYDLPASPPLDRVLLVYFPAPHSFTGEEMVEIHTHGSPVVVGRVLEVFYQQGIRAAQPGEFSLRACQNGKMDLVRAEALMHLLHSSSLMVARESARQMGGSLSKTVFALRDLLLTSLVQLEANLDFADEEIDPADGQAIDNLLAQVEEKLRQLGETGLLGRQMSHGFHLVIAGRPNVGKSSLFNLLLGHDKAIVTPIAGTTRDMNDATLTVAGLPVCLVDTAGLRESQDPVEKIGVSRARDRLSQADGILWVLDASSGLVAEDEALGQELLLQRGIIVWNKRDCASPEWTPPQLFPSDWPSVEVSCLTGGGMAGLLAAIATLLAPMPKEGGGILMAERHRQAVDRALQETSQARQVLQQNGPLEIASLHSRAALTALEEMVGFISDTDVLHGIFNRFCIGK